MSSIPRIHTSRCTTLNRRGGASGSADPEVEKGECTRSPDLGTSDFLTSQNQEKRDFWDFTPGGRGSGNSRVQGFGAGCDSQRGQGGGIRGGELRRK